MAAAVAERLAQHALRDRADFPQRGVAAAVQDRRARFEALHAERVERKTGDQLRPVLEHARAPERRTDGKAPFSRSESAPEVANLEDADGRVVTDDRHGEARVGAGAALTQRPGDEALEA